MTDTIFIKGKNRICTYLFGMCNSVSTHVTLPLCLKHKVENINLPVKKIRKFLPYK
jgi:hypothetical protein